MLPLGRGEKVLVVQSERERLLRDEEMLALRRWRAASAPRNITNVTQYPIVDATILQGRGR
jgi:hypothetical protein